MSKKAPHKSSKKPLLTLIFIIINILVISLTAFSEFSNREHAAKLSEVQISWWLIIPAMLCFLVAIMIEIFKYALMIRKTCSERFSEPIWKIARRTVLIGRYYDNITPAAIGGQPFQIYYMKKSGLSSGFSTTIPIFGMISGQIAFLIIATFAFLLGSFTINNAALIATACFGLIFYAFFPITVMIATFLPKATTEIITIGVKFLAKLHIVKDRASAIERTKRGVNEYAICVKSILKTRGLFLKTILLSMLFHILVCSIPFFVLTAFGGQIDFLPCFVTTVVVTSAIYFIPTPGNAGAAEGTFYLVFSALASGYVFWAMLTWRFFSYYIYIILGAISYFFMHLEKKDSGSWWQKFKSSFHP